MVDSKILPICPRPLYASRSERCSRGVNFFVPLELSSRAMDLNMLASRTLHQKPARLAGHFMPTSKTKRMSSAPSSKKTSIVLWRNSAHWFLVLPTIEQRIEVLGEYLSGLMRRSRGAFCSIWNSNSMRYVTPESASDSLIYIVSCGFAVQSQSLIVYSRLLSGQSTSAKLTESLAFAGSWMDSPLTISSIRMFWTIENSRVI